MKLVKVSCQPSQGKISNLMRNSQLDMTQSQDNLELEPFFRDVRKFFSSAADNMVSKYSFDDELLTYAVVVDIAKRHFVKFYSLRFFICRFPSILPEEVTVDRVEMISGCIKPPAFMTASSTSVLMRPGETLAC